MHRSKRYGHSLGCGIMPLSVTRFRDINSFIGIIKLRGDLYYQLAATINNRAKRLVRLKLRLNLAGEFLSSVAEKGDKNG